MFRKCDLLILASFIFVMFEFGEKFAKRVGSNNLINASKFFPRNSIIEFRGKNFDAFKCYAKQAIYSIKLLLFLHRRMVFYRSQAEPRCILLRNQKSILKLIPSLFFQRKKNFIGSQKIHLPFVTGFFLP